MTSNSAKELTIMKIKTDVKLSNTDDDNIAGSASATSESVIPEDDANTLSGVFTIDILPEIFDNLGILSTKDLLNFRLVSRSWRDAATSVLLKQNVCRIILDYRELTVDEDKGGNAVAQANLDEMDPNENHYQSFLRSDRYFNVYQPRSVLSDLSQLISTSPKFPSTSICFYNFCPADFNHESQQDLIHFFSLYGKKIKKLSLSCTISEKALKNLLHVHLPHLNCLNLRDLDNLLLEDEEEESEMQVCLPPPPLGLELDEILLNKLNSDSTSLENYFSFLKELIEVSPCLAAIRNVDVTILQVLLDMGKVHLIKEIYVHSFLHHLSTIQQFTNILTVKILKDKLPSFKLTTIAVRPRDFRNKNTFDIMLTFLNIILSSSKDSLKVLELQMTPLSHLFNVCVPPLPHLELLYLGNGNYESCPTTRFHFLGDVIRRAVRAGKVTPTQLALEVDALSFQNPERNRIIPANYFPRLRQVSFDHSQNVINGSDNLPEFFSLERLASDGVTRIPGDTLLTVTTLSLSKGWDISGISRVFPNVVNLDLSVKSSDILPNWVWTAFLKLEKFEITAMGHDWNTNAVDSFFTGISHELCATIFDNDATTTIVESSSAHVLERTQPYIGDCMNLKKLKINFLEKLSSGFATKVTAAHGFQQVVHRTKIIFSFKAGRLSKKEIEETRQNLDAVADYVKLEMEGIIRSSCSLSWKSQISKPNEFTDEN